MDAADTGFDHLCSPHRPRHYELRRGVGNEEGSLELPRLPFSINGTFVRFLFKKHGNNKNSYEIIWMVTRK